MSYPQVFTTFVFDDIEVEITAAMQYAEPDVGIIDDFIDDYRVTAVDGDTNVEVCKAMDQRITAEMGEGVLIKQLYDEM
jgi:hypothetical protein